MLTWEVDTATLASVQTAAAVVDDLGNGTDNARPAFWNLGDSDDDGVDTELLDQGRSVTEPFGRMVALLSNQLDVCVRADAGVKSRVCITSVLFYTYTIVAHTVFCCLTATYRQVLC